MVELAPRGAPCASSHWTASGVIGVIGALQSAAVVVTVPPSEALANVVCCTGKWDGGAAGGDSVEVPVGSDEF